MPIPAPWRTLHKRAPEAADREAQPKRRLCQQCSTRLAGGSLAATSAPTEATRTKTCCADVGWQFESFVGPSSRHDLQRCLDFLGPAVERLEYGYQLCSVSSILVGTCPPAQRRNGQSWHLAGGPFPSLGRKFVLKIAETSPNGGPFDFPLISTKRPRPSKRV